MRCPSASGAEVDVSRLSGRESGGAGVDRVDIARARQLGIEAAARTAAQKLASRRPWPGAAPTQLLPLSDVVVIDNDGWFAPRESIDVAALVGDVRRGKRLRIDYRAQRAAGTQRSALSIRTVSTRGEGAGISWPMSMANPACSPPPRSDHGLFSKSTVSFALTSPSRNSLQLLCRGWRSGTPSGSPLFLTRPPRTWRAASWGTG